MSAIAQLLLGLGHQVSGSDIKPSAVVEKLSFLGAKVFIGQRPQNVREVDLVVFSSAIKDNNPELLVARDQHILTIQRAKMLAWLMDGKCGIAITGTHGKTTTASLIASVLIKAGLSPTVAIGGELEDLGGSALLGQGPYFVAEADESDGSFLELDPTYSVLTNIEEEHLDFYHGIDDILEAFRRFAEKTKQDGALIGCVDDGYVKEILSSCGRRSITYGLAQPADIYPKNVAVNRFGSQFDCWYKDKLLGPIKLGIPQRHNIMNALAAVGVAMELGIDFDSLRESLASYRGAARRFEIKLDTDELVVIDDYAHHPTEVEATLNSCRAEDRRVVAIFQPHRYTRTKYLGHLFGRAFASADQLILTDIYPADEEPLEGITSQTIYDAVRREGHQNVELVATKEDALDFVLKISKPDDLVVCLGAGDIGWVADELAKRFNKR